MLSIPYRWFFYFYIEQAEVREETFFESTLPGALKAKSNGNDRRQWRKQGVAVGGRGLQDASAAQGTKQMQGAATRIYRMNLLETLALLTFILALLSLIVDVIRLTVEVMAKFSQMKSDDNKKD